MLSFYCGAPQWLVEVAIEPKSNGDQEKLVAALARLAAEDPSFRFSVDPQSGQIILKGMGEIQLATKVDLLKSAYQIDARVGALQVAFLERITTRVEHSFTHKMQTGAAGRFAAVTLLVEPNEPGRGNVFESRVTDGAVPAHYTPGVEKGVESVLSSGVVAGYPVVDVRVRLLDGKYHDGDSTVMAFEIATRACFREALQMGKSVLLEPVMAVEVVTLDDRADSVIRNMDLRRGQIVRRYIRDGATVIDALVPLMNMFGYVNDLREIGESRATFIMRFDHYAEAPPNGDGHPPAFPPAIGMRA